MQTASPTAMTEAQGTSAAAFEGGVEDACDDACSICLENFGEDDPATRTTCRHEYHLQCILEWAQRSKECPICWRALRLEDAESHSLLAASEQERVLREQRSSASYQRSTFDDIEFYRFALSYGDDSDLEDRILHHLAAADVGRVQQFGRRGELITVRRLSGQGHPHCMIVPVHPNPSSTHLPSTSVASAGNFFVQSTTSSPDVVRAEVGTSSVASGRSTSAYGGLIIGPAGGGRVLERGSLESSTSPWQAPAEHVDESQRGTSSSELVSETFKSRLAAASSKYRESLTKTTRGFKERLRVRSSTMAELGNRARGMSAGVVRALERMSLESPDQNRGSSIAPNSSAGIDAHVGTMLVPSGPSCVKGD